jgi:broad specificity phosphatase PhoE
VAIRIVCETHATTTDNEAGIATGWLPGELSPLGRHQARELGERRRDDGLAAVFSSDLRRAVDTVRIAFAGSAVPVRQDARLRECDYGALNGHPAAIVAPLRARHVDEPFPGGQSYRDVVAATDDFLRELAREFPDGSRVLLVAHSANLWALERLLNGARLSDLVSASIRWRPGWEYDVLPANPAR